MKNMSTQNAPTRTTDRHFCRVRMSLFNRSVGALRLKIGLLFEDISSLSHNFQTYRVRVLKFSNLLVLRTVTVPAWDSQDNSSRSSNPWLRSFTKTIPLRLQNSSKIPEIFWSACGFRNRSLKTSGTTVKPRFTTAQYLSDRVKAGHGGTGWLIHGKLMTH